MTTKLDPLAAETSKAQQLLASYAHWQEFRGVAEPDRFVLHTEAVEEWIEQFGQRPGFDPFDDEGAFELEAAEAAIRRGEVW